MLLKKYTAYNIQLIMEIESAIKWLHHVDWKDLYANCVLDNQSPFIYIIATIFSKEHTFGFQRNSNRTANSVVQTI